jgi:hypothetical protein
MESLQDQKPNGEIDSPACTLHSTDIPNDEENPDPHQDEVNTTQEENEVQQVDEPATASPDRQEKAALEEAKLRSIWQETMNGFGLTGKPHRNVAVLMLWWANELDDLHTTDEVEQLQRVFEDYFHYVVVLGQLSADKRPGNQLTKHLADFVYEHEAIQRFSLSTMRGMAYQASLESYT